MSTQPSNAVQTQAAAKPAQPTTVPAMWQKFAEVVGASPGDAKAVLKATIMPNATDAEVLAFVAVCAAHELNPVLRQIYAFPSKSGGIVPMISIDGWIAMVQRHPLCNGFSFKDEDRNDKPFAVTCTMQRRDWSSPVVATEYLEECKRNTDHWRERPRRMLRHRAFIQAARLAFGFGGLTDEDEIGESQAKTQAQAEPRLAEVEALTRGMDPKHAKAQQEQPAQVERQQWADAEGDPEREAIQAEADIDPQDVEAFR